MTPTETELAEALRGVDLFAGIPEDSLTNLAAQMRTFEYKPGEHIVEEDTGHGLGRMYVVLRGMARAEVDGTPVAAYGPGDHFGEMSLLDNKPRSATVIAASDLTVAGLASWNLHATLLEEPQIAINMLEALATRLRAANEQHR
jgi:CRP/FNR family cyclic AMP-dependent transcriptional regulator